MFCMEAIQTIIVPYIVHASNRLIMISLRRPSFVKPPVLYVLAFGTFVKFLVIPSASKSKKYLIFKVQISDNIDDFIKYKL
jgi:hypothetical protein